MYVKRRRGYRCRSSITAVVVPANPTAQAVKGSGEAHVQTPRSHALLFLTWSQYMIRRIYAPRAACSPPGAQGGTFHVSYHTTGVGVNYIVYSRGIRTSMCMRGYCFDVRIASRFFCQYVLCIVRSGE